ncbi:MULTISPECIES: hypothetical protein [unclassified Streptomyces]|uniref:hypothetical protein n=1 Tax=unclassified Streptomyces TaxID=2593676 RepID=UPI002DDAA1AB|nr:MULTISPECIES: hypothetical protein [unclassified Streptomyces]WSC34568.1 hypothetical protein OHA08_02895 [Streptomyces sp. NBC_01763]WSC58160.1 hypothetical protein OG808_41450 [Streptomyces sp. NBC_01761]WSF89261.1 hypothetical protein OIE70_43000 [Streptomyces sp. NBC_01744]
MSAAPDDGAARAYGYAPPAAGSARRAELDRLLDLAVRDTGAHAGAVFLLAPDGQALRLEVTTGMPAEYLAPWLGVLAGSVLSEEAGSTRPGEWARPVKYHWIESGNYPGLHFES